MANIKDIHGNLLSLSASDILIPSLGVSLADAIAQRLLPVPDNVTEQVEGLETKVSHAVGLISSVTVDVATDDTGTTHAEGAYKEGVLAITLYNVKGDKGEPLTFDDLTDAQKAELKGEKLTFADLTEDDKNELRGAEGEGGKSAYDLAVENGFVGTEAEWLASLKGEKGEPGDRGANGADGADGRDGADGIEAGTNITIDTLSDGKKRISAQLASGTAQAASEVSYNNVDGTQTNLQDKIRLIDNNHYYANGEMSGEEIGSIDVETLLFTTEGHHRTMSIQPNSIYEVEAGDSDVFLFFVKNGNLVVGEEYPHSESTRTAYIIPANSTERIAPPLDTVTLLWNADSNPVNIVYCGSQPILKDPDNPVDKLARICNNSCKWAVHNKFIGWGEFDISNWMQSSKEQAMRQPVASAYGFVALLTSGKLDSTIVQQSEYGLKLQIHRLVMATISLHKTNHDAPNWGGEWQAGLWAAYSACCVLSMPDLFSAEEKQMCRNMVLDEADRLCTKTTCLYWKNLDGTEQYAGDTQADNMSWDAGLLGIAYSAYGNANKYLRKFIEFSVITYSAPKDYTEGGNVNGYSFKSLQGSNYNDDGTTFNHGKIHPDYIMSYSNIVELLPHLVNGWTIPICAVHNIDLLAKGLTETEFTAGQDIVVQNGHKTTMYPGGAIIKEGIPSVYYPMGNDWGNTPRLYHMPTTFAAIMHYWGIPAKHNWLNILNTFSDALLTMQSRYTTGQTFMTWDDNNIATQQEDSYEGRELTISSIVGTALAIATHTPHWTLDGLYDYTVTFNTVNGNDEPVAQNLRIYSYDRDKITFALNTKNGTGSISLPSGWYYVSGNANSVPQCEDADNARICTLYVDGEKTFKLIF